MFCTRIRVLQPTGGWIHWVGRWRLYLLQRLGEQGVIWPPMTIWWLCWPVEFRSRTANGSWKPNRAVTRTVSVCRDLQKRTTLRGNGLMMIVIIITFFSALHEFKATLQFIKEDVDYAIFGTWLALIKNVHNITVQFRFTSIQSPFINYQCCKQHGSPNIATPASCGVEHCSVLLSATSAGVCSELQTSVFLAQHPKHFCCRSSMYVKQSACLMVR